MSLAPMSGPMNPPSLLLARTPALPSTSTSSTHMPSSKADYAYPSAGPSGSSLSTPPRSSLSPLANLHHAFSADSALPGTVEVRVEATVFLVHKEIMVHASPFFEVLLSGDWAETSGLDDDPKTDDDSRGRPRCDSCEQARRRPSRALETSRSSSPGLGSRRDLHRLSAAESFVTTHTSNEPMSPLEEATLLLPEPPRPPSVRLRRARPLSTASIATQSDPDSGNSLAVPSTPTASSPGATERDADEKTIASSYVDDDLGLEVERPPAQRFGGRKLDARIHLKEEQAAPFQDLLMFVYPQLEVSPVLSSLVIIRADIEISVSVRGTMLPRCFRPLHTAHSVLRVCCAAHDDGPQVRHAPPATSRSALPPLFCGRQTNPSHADRRGPPAGGPLPRKQPVPA